jgi:hypothetical protein
MSLAAFSSISRSWQINQRASKEAKKATKNVRHLPSGLPLFLVSFLPLRANVGDAERLGNVGGGHLSLQTLWVVGSERKPRQLANHVHPPFGKMFLYIGHAGFPEQPDRQTSVRD